MKLYDFDGMFEEKLSAYIAKNSSQHSEEEWEDIIPELYKKFGDTPIKSLGKTPREYFSEMSSPQLIKCLKSHIKNGVPVPEFLCREIEGRKMTKELLPLLDGSADEAEYAMNLLGADPAAMDKYMSMLIHSDDADMKERCAEFIKEGISAGGEGCGKILSAAKENYKKGADREFMLEIMSRSAVKDDGVFEILLKEFRSDPDNVPMHASYLAAYGDGRALQYLLDKIDGEGITFIEYQELKFAIEALGGEYKKERDFSSDPYYRLIKPEG